MKKIIILFISLLLIQSICAITDKQRDNIKLTLSLAESSNEFTKLLELLNKNNVDLSNEDEIANEIIIKNELFNINLNNYPNIQGLKIEKEKPKKIGINFAYIIGYILVIVLVTVLIVEICKTAKVNKEMKIETQFDELQQYIESEIKSGKDKEQLKNELIQTGWDTETLSRFL